MKVKVWTDDGEDWCKLKQVEGIIAERVRKSKNVIGAVIVDSYVDSRVVLEGCDLLLVIFVEDTREVERTSYAIFGEQQIKEYWINLSPAAIVKEHFSMDWLLKGRIIYDPEERLKKLTHWITSYPEEVSRRGACLEFSLLLCSYEESKAALRQGYLFDAFSRIQKGMWHWARLSAYQLKLYPQPPVWEQTKRTNPQVYKLYEELISGSEPLEQRLRLIVLAIEFFIGSHLKECSSYLIERIAGQKKVWSIEQLLQQVWEQKLDRELFLMLEKLVQHSFLKTVLIEQSGFIQRGYQVAD